MSERRSSNTFIHHDAARFVPSDEADEYIFQSHLFSEERSVHRGLASLNPSESEVSPCDSSITYIDQAESWAQPIHFYGNGAGLYTMHADSGDADGNEQDAILPTGLPMAGPFDSAEDYYASLDPYLEPASTNIEMPWSDSKGFLPDDGSGEYTDQTLNLLAFQQ